MISKNGFSLLEILISTFMLSLSSFSVFKMYIYLEKEKSNSQMLIDAAYFARFQSALLKSVNVEQGCGDITLLREGMCTLKNTSPYQVSWNVKQTLKSEDTLLEYAKLIEIRVDWTDRNQKVQVLKLPVTISKYTNRVEY